MKHFLFVVILLVAGMAFEGCHKVKLPEDTQKPFIVVKGANPIYSELDKEYHDPGANAFDITATGDTIDITNQMKVTDNINIHKRGTYKVYYNVSDEAGNQADEKIRNVIIEIFK
jgi:hypothetical protein